MRETRLGGRTIMKIRKTKYGKIILGLAEELYENEVVDTNMERLVIGEGKDYDSKEDWIDCRIDAYVLRDEQ